MKEPIIIDSTSHEVISSELFKITEERGAHFTNGTYILNLELILPTTLAGFQYIVTHCQADLPIVVAINSDVSMEALDKREFESQENRAKKIAGALAETFPDNQVVIVFYDETTPTALYQKLAETPLTRTLHKWGYGLAPNTPKVEGAECFDQVFAFKLPNEQQPVCFNQTESSNTPQAVPVDLMGDLIDYDGVLFQLPESLKAYQSPSFNISTAFRN